MEFHITGIVPAVFTPMHKNGDINLDLIPALTQFLIEEGAGGLYVCGSTGEGPSMTREERMAVAESYIQAAAGRIPVIVQVGHNSIRESQQLAAHAQAHGADAISAVPPSYFRATSLDNLMDILADILTAAPALPFYYYHIPHLTNTPIDVVRFLEMSAQRLPTLVGVKYSTFTVFEMQNCLSVADGRYNMLFGSDEMLLSGLVAGAHGAVGSTYNFALPLFRRIIATFESGDISEAQRCQALAAKMVRHIFAHGPDHPALKAMMGLIGFDCGPARLPHGSIAKEAIPALRQDMEEIGYFTWGRAQVQHEAAEMRVAMIGVGHWHAQMHLRSLQLADEAVIVGVSDEQTDVVHAFAQSSGGIPFTDYREMLTAVQPDFVLAMGRPVEMPAIGRDLIVAGIPCALEKPVGVSASDILPLVELAQARRAFVAVPFTKRYSNMWGELARLEQAGRVGKRAHAHFRIINGPPRRYEEKGVSWMLQPAVSGGGSLRNLGIHAADAFLHFVQGESVEVLSAAISHQIYGREVEEFGAALLRSASGVLGTIEAGYTLAAMAGSDYESRLSTANCSLIDRGDQLQVMTLDDGQIQYLDNRNQSAHYDKFSVDTLARLRQGQPPIATLVDCYRAMELVDKMYLAADSKSEVI